MNANDSDEDLMGRVKAGDRAAYHALYERWNGRVHGFLLKRTGAAQEAEEALQETWLRVFRSRRRFRDGCRFMPWLYAIAVNAGRDARVVRPEVFHFGGPHHDQHELRDQLVRALHLLDAKDRRLMLLAAEGFTSPEVGEILGLREGTVRMRLSRIREQLRDALGGPNA